MKLVSGIVDSGFFAQSALSAEVATKDSLGRNISETYLTAVDIPESAVWNATTQTVSANSAQWAGSTANPQIPVTGINGIKISESGDKVVFEVSGDYYPGNNPSGFITGVDLSNYATTAQVAEKQDLLTFGYHDTAISSIDESALYDNSAHARINTLAGRISDLSSNKLDSAIYANDSGTFLTALPQDLVYTADIADMATTSQVAEKLDTTAFSTVSGDFLTAHQDLSDYQTTAGMTAYQSAGNYLTTGDSANFYTTANESGFISEVPAGTMNESAFEYDANDKISGYNGSAFAGGSDVPEGVMVESGLEYDNTEISGYSGSAFKDVALTDVVTVNSGVWGGSALPISAGPGIKFDMVDGILVASTDETVLFESTAADGTTVTTASPITLTEDYSNFSRMLIEYRIWTDQSFKYILEEVPCRNGFFTLSHGYINAPLNPTFYQFLYGLSGNEGKLYYSFGRFNAMGQNGLTTVNELNIMGVTGINRIAGGI